MSGERLRRVPLVGLAAVILGALIVQFALAGDRGRGDRSQATISISKKKLKKLISNEVAKQVAKATGPQGIQGMQGVQGIQGAPGVPGSDGLPGGVSIGVASGPGTPPATSSRSLEEVSIDLPQPAKLYVTGSSTASVTCSAAGACSRAIGLYVDSAANPIVNSEYDLGATASSTVTRDISLVGVTPTLAAGGHSLKLFSTDVGNVASAADENSNIAAISLGG